MKRRRRFLPAVILAAAVLGGFLLGGCGGKSADTQSGMPANDWAIKGQIVSVNKDRGTLTVHHEDIPGLMPSMIMEFKVSPGDLANAKPGEHIRGRLHRAGDDFTLEKIWPDDEVERKAVAEAAEALKKDTEARGDNPYRAVGEQAPDFTLYDQDGRVVQASRFEGHLIVLNFIFTRCPDPNMCPAATAKMIALQKQAKEAGIKNVEFISITLDPKYDTPGVLHEYAAARGIDTSNYSFLTGPEAAVKNLMDQLGVIAIAKDGLITHSLATLLIDEHGKIIHREDGTAWPIGQFLSRLKHA